MTAPQDPQTKSQGSSGTSEANPIIPENLGVTSEEECLVKVRELMVDPLDEITLEFDAVTLTWHLLRKAQGKHTARHLAEGKNFDEVLWKLQTSAHPKASQGRVTRRARAAVERAKAESND